jgi:hypothetical protein
MDNILGFVKNLDTFQLILLAAGAFLLWPTIQGYLGDFWDDSEKKPVVHNESELADLVCKWECLADGCREHGLDEACVKLKEVFPMLVDAHKEEEENDVEKERRESGVTT